MKQFAPAAAHAPIVSGVALMPPSTSMSTSKLRSTIHLRIFSCVKIKILRRVRAESSRRPPRHRRDACSMAWRCRILAARPSQDGRVIAEK